MIVIKDDLELRDALLALLAYPIVDLLMRAVLCAPIWQLVCFEYFGCSAEPLQEVRFVFCGTIEEWKRLGQERTPIDQTLITDL